MSTVGLCQSLGAGWRFLSAVQRTDGLTSASDPKRSFGHRLNSVKKRDTLLALIALGAVPGSLLAQASMRPHRVAVVFTGSAESDRIYLEAFQQGLRQHGYQEGDKLKFELGYAAGRTDRVLALIREAVARNPDVIVLTGSAAAWAAKKATSTIPIVMAQVGDPVTLGLVASFARPGGNITGNAIQGEAFVPKSLELLHESLPAVRTIFVMADPAMPAITQIWTAVESTAKRLGVTLVRFDASTLEEIDRALSAWAKRPPGAALVFPMPLFSAHRRKIVDALRQNRIPAMMGSLETADMGVLMSYLSNTLDLWRKAATYVHRILQGAKPSELPFEQAARFEFSINLKTAKALGIKIPQSVLVRADRVIE